MTANRRFPQLCLSMVLLACATSQAQSLRCGQDFAQIGDTKFVIESKCGAPAAKDCFCKPIGVAPSTITMPPHAVCDMVEEWTYKPGIGQFITILQFREGALREMKYGPRQ
jgi:hypothetical protein